MIKTSIRSLAAAALLAAAMPAVAENGMTLTPAPGEVYELSQFKISFDGEWALANRRAKFTVSGPEGVEIPTIYSYSEGTCYVVYFEDDAVLTEPGDYTLTVPAGKFEIGGEENEETSFNYTIVGSGTLGDFPAYTISPEPGALESVTSFTLTFDTDDAITANVEKILLSGPTDSYGLKADVQGSVLTLTPVDAYGAAMELTAAGDYTLRIGVGALMAGNVPNPEVINFEYSIGSATPAWTGSYDADPVSGTTLEKLSEVFITFNGVTLVSITDSAGPKDFPKVYDAATEEVVSTCTAFASGNVLDVSLNSAITAPGNYRLVVPAAFYRVDGAASDVQIDLEYKVENSQSAVSASMTDSEVIDVYDAAGRLILRKADSKAIQSLPKGLYIISNHPLLK